MYNCEKPPRPSAKNNEPDESSYILQDKKSSSLRRGGRITAAWDEDWGWYVVSGCAFANFLLPGMLRCFGPDVLEGFTEKYDLGTRWACLWIPMVFDLTFSIAGAISCFLCELTSHRTITLWGGLLASIGMMLSLFANSILYLYISYGIMVGIGAGVCYPAGILIVNEYFHESRGLANGLSLVGTTVGSIAMPPYIKFLTSSYGYRGGILIVSGIMLNVLACALTYSPAQEKHTPDVQFADTMTTSSSSSSSSRSSINARVAAASVVRFTKEYYTGAACCINPSVQVTTEAVTAADIVTTDEYYADVVVSSPLLEHHVQHREEVAGLRRTFGGRPTALLLAVSAVNALSEMAYGTFAATSTPRPSDTKAALWLAAADAAGRVLVPAVSDHLSSGSGGRSASIYLNAVIMAVGGAVLLTAGSARQSPATEWSLCLILAFGLVSGGAVGLEPLVAVHVLGHDRLPASCSATMLAKGAAGLAVHLLFFPMAGHYDYSVYRPPQHRIPANVALYTLGSCLVAAAAGWTARLLMRPHFYTPENGCSQYMRTA